MKTLDQLHEMHKGLKEYIELLEAKTNKARDMLQVVEGELADRGYIKNPAEHVKRTANYLPPEEQPKQRRAVTPVQQSLDLQLQVTPPQGTRFSSLSKFIYWALSAHPNGEFTSRSLTEYAQKNFNRGQTFKQSRNQVQTALRHMRDNPQLWPELAWHQKPRSGGGVIYTYHWNQ